jgi:ornithine cyclodeaminase/alanine dehydrogenase-like protein (mu-crystallin family)
MATATSNLSNTSKFVILSDKDVKQHYSYRKSIELLEDMFRYIDRYLLPVRTIVSPEKVEGWIGVMPSYGEKENVFGVKAITSFAGNIKQGFDSHLGAVMLFDCKTGHLKALMNAASITAVRTGAASVVATKFLAREEAQNLAIIGTGVQARAHIFCMREVRHIKRCTVAGRNFEHVRALVDELKDSFDFPVVACESVEEAVRDADIICTTTASREPVLKREWIKEGCHINLVGATNPKTREVDSQTVADAIVYVDSMDANLKEAGDLLIPIDEGTIKREHIKGDLHYILTRGTKDNALREMNSLTLFSSMGIATEDLVSANYLYELAREKNIGNWVEM